MRKITKVALIGTFLCAGSIALADAPEPVNDRWESEAVRGSSINATYVIVGILATFLIVDAINDADSDE